MSNKTQNELKNPMEYTYKEDSKVEIEGGFLLELIKLVDTLLDNEINTTCAFKYKYVDKSGNVVNTVKGIAPAGSSKLLDLDATLTDSEFEHRLTSKGHLYLEFKKHLEIIHFDNIKKGVAIKS